MSRIYGIEYRWGCWVEGFPFLAPEVSNFSDLPNSLLLLSLKETQRRPRALLLWTMFRDLQKKNVHQHRAAHPVSAGLSQPDLVLQKRLRLLLSVPHLH